MTGRAVARRARRAAAVRVSGRFAIAPARGQSLVEFAMLVPVFLLLLLGMIEFGFAFTHNQTLEYATREGARVGASLANGGGTLGCGTGQSPNASIVDPLIIAAVERVLKSPGSPVQANLKSVDTITIYKSNASGNPVASNVWKYNTPSGGGGPLVSGVALDYSPTTSGWTACSRNNLANPDSLGVSLHYTYSFITPLGGVLRFFGGTSWSSLQMGDQTVMALEPTQ